MQVGVRLLVQFGVAANGFPAALGACMKYRLQGSQRADVRPPCLGNVSGRPSGRPWLRRPLRDTAAGRSRYCRSAARDSGYVRDALVAMFPHAYAPRACPEAALRAR